MQTDSSLRMKDSELDWNHPPLSSCSRSSSLMYNLFTLDSRACLVLPDCGVWLSLGCRSHWVVSQSCVVSLLHIHIWAKPISTGSTRKTPFTSCGLRVEPLHMQGEAVSPAWWPWEHVLGDEADLLSCSQGKIEKLCISRMHFWASEYSRRNLAWVSLLPQPSGLLWGSWSCFIPSPLGCPSAL